MKMTSAACIKRSEMILTLLISCTLVVIVATYFTIFFEFMFLPTKILIHAVTVPLVALLPEYFALLMLCWIYYKNTKKAVVRF